MRVRVPLPTRVVWTQKKKDNEPPNFLIPLVVFLPPPLRPPPHLTGNQISVHTLFTPKTNTYTHKNALFVIFFATR